MTTAPGVRLAQVAGRLRAAGLLEDLRGDGATEVRGVSQDSRSAGPGQLFLAWEGVERDAHDFVPEAVAAGCVAVVAERAVEGVDVPFVLVRDGRAGGALAADEVMGSPWKELFLAGVTGTNGKTTTSLLARHLLAGERSAAALGTLGLVGPEGVVRPGTEGLTTPGPVQLSGWLRTLADEGVAAVVMEASSHALQQKRLDGCCFDGAVFTNLAHDHLDYHGTAEEYRQAKHRLAELLAPRGGAVVNGEDPAWHGLPCEPSRTLTFRRVPGGPPPEGEVSVAGGRILEALEVRMGGEGSSFRLRVRDPAGEEQEEAWVHLPLLGDFNVENALAACGLALVAGRSLDEIARRLESMPQIPGRLEVAERRAFTVLLDFAHTPDALTRVLETLRPLFPGRLIVVFGAGGDRDRSKRAPMGRVVAEKSDVAIVTSDNPRTEDPETIIDEIVAGMAGSEFQRVADRREAIRRALRLAHEGDAVLLAGKGHERHQTVGTEKHPFDEREIVREILGTEGREDR